MNKEFKIWNGESWLNSQEHAIFLDGKNLHHTYGDEYGCVGGSEINFPIYQWTGASDKNNKQIFEGDIVLWNNPDPYNDEEFLTRIVGYNSRTMGYRLYNSPEEIGQAAGSSFFPEDVEVIGNIFEGAIKDGVNYGKWRVAK